MHYRIHKSIMYMTKCSSEEYFPNTIYHPPQRIIGILGSIQRLEAVYGRKFSDFLVKKFNTINTRKKT